MANVVARAFGDIGWRVVICSYAALNGLDPNYLKRDGVFSNITLSDLGFNSLPMLSSTFYRMRYEDDLDFDAVLGMRIGQAIGRRNSCTTTLPAELLHPDSTFRQKLYGLAARVDELLHAISPDLIVIQHGGEVISRILLAKSLKLGIPWLISESAFIPNHILLDPCGQHFIRGHNQIDSDALHWMNTPLTPTQQQQIKMFVSHWQSRRISKYAQPDKKSPELVSFLAEPGPILFVPMQISDDANVHYGLGIFDSLDDFYQSLVEALPGNWRAVFKPHPLDTRLDPWRPPTNPRIHFTVNANIHDLITRADAVAVFSSNVGLEALFYGKPVLVGGKPCYGGKGFTLDIDDREQLAKLISHAPDFRADMSIRDRFLYFLLNDYLVPVGNSDALRRKLARLASNDQQQLTNQRSPFCEADPPHVRAHLPLLARYRHLAEQDCSHDEITAKLDLCNRPEFLLLSGKDQPSPWIHTKDTGIVMAYSFAACLARNARNVLDYGSGDGFGAWLLAQTGLRVTACTSSENLLDYARRTWLHRRVDYRNCSHGRVISGSLQPTKWQMVIVIDSLTDSYRPGELLTALTHTVSKGGALLVRIVNPKKAIAPNRFCPRYFIDPQQIVDWCQKGRNSLELVQSFFQQSTTIGLDQLHNFDYQWLLFSRGATEDWHYKLSKAISTYPSSLPNETSIAGLWMAALRRRRKWLKG